MDIRQRLEEIVVERDKEIAEHAKTEAKSKYIENIWNQLRALDETAEKKQLHDAVKKVLAYEAFDADIKFISTSNAVIIQLLNTKDTHEQGGYEFPQLIDIELHQHEFHRYIDDHLNKFPDAFVKLLIDALVGSTIVYDDD